MFKRNIISFSALLVLASNNAQAINNLTPIALKERPGFFRLSYDNVKMPNNIENMGLLGLNYFADLTPSVYAGVGMYGSLIGTQGGLFVLSLGGGLHHELFSHLWGDLGVDIGGGGGRSSLVGGGLMLRPHIGLEYDFGLARLGAHYSYIDFPSGEVRSSQVGLDLDIPFNFYYVPSQNQINCSLFSIKDLVLPVGKYFNLHRNDFAIILQAYDQHSGTKNTNGVVQDGTIGLVGAELDHYVTDHLFGYIKTSGAFTGIPNGYMDILAGLGYHWNLGQSRFALVPQLGAGAGGGGLVDTGGGVIIQPQLGFEIPLSQSFSARTSGGYLWSPKGQMGAYSLTGALLYHLDIATADCRPHDYSSSLFALQNWRINIFNQTYIHPQRTFSNTKAAINLLALQFDQIFNNWFFMAYQGSFAYAGYHAGGYATGMIGPGLQSSSFLNHRARLFTEVLIGAGGGGALALGGGSLIEPVAGLHYKVTNTIGLQVSAAYLKALQNSLSTPVINAGFTINFGTLNKV